MWNWVYTNIYNISSISIADVALIKASWYALTDEKFQCRKMFEKLSQRSDAEIVIRLEKQKRGCGVYTDSPKIVIDDEFGFHTCLCEPSLHHPNINELLFLFENFKRGLLPYNGSITDQPAQIIEMFQLIENLHFEREQAIQKKTQSEAEAKAKKSQSPRKR